ncbi:MAG: sporulation protein YunB [Clostridia bacterium]|nr:sporulation protein YunB [Clostridia bacterium]
MRLGAKRRICIRSNRVNKKKLSVGLVFLLIFVLLFGCTAYFVKIIRPVMMELAKTRATVLAELAIHRAVGNLFAGTDYREIVSVTKLEDGTVSSIESNMSRVNELKASAAISISEEIAAIDETELAIPMGTLTGSDILAGIGPKLPVTLMPYGSVIVDFKTDFTETGINQTLLSVTLTAKANVGIVMPTVNMTREITTEIPVTQTVIVGKIPDNYVNIDRMGEDYEGDVLDIIG